MANLASSAVTINDQWSEGGTNSRRYNVYDATLVLTGQGGTTNKILASLFYMNNIVEVKSARSSANALVMASPSYDGTYIILTASSGAAADVTATVRLVVKGY